MSLKDFETLSDHERTAFDSLTEGNRLTLERMFSPGFTFDEAFGFYMQCITRGVLFPIRWEARVLELGVAALPDRDDLRERLDDVRSLLRLSTKPSLDPDVAESEPIEAVCQNATILFQRDETRTKAHDLLKFVIDQQPDNQVALMYLSKSELLNGNASIAATLAEKLSGLSGSSVAVLALARALVAGGNPAGARAAVQRHLAHGGEWFDRRKIGQEELINLLLLEITGQTGASDELSRRMCRENDIALLDRLVAERLGVVDGALDRMRSSASGRDIAIFGRGPSLHRMRNDLDQIRSRDFIPFAINDFRELHDSILAPIGRSPELVCFTNYDLLTSLSDLVLRAFDKDAFLGLCLPSFVRDELVSGSSDRTFRERLLSSPSRLFFFGSEQEDSLPTPADPLMFPGVNTLICALGVAALAQPRRIFLFGFDGQVDAGTGDYYYGDQSLEYTRGALQDVQRQVKQWLWWDAFRVNHVAPCFMRQLHHLHDVDVPIVYNVSPESAITCFPRIGVSDFLDLTSSCH